MPGRREKFSVGVWKCSGNELDEWWRQIVPRARSGKANERSPSDDVVRGTATEPDVADLRPALGSRCSRRRDEVGQVTWCFAVQATVNSHTRLVLTIIMSTWKSMAQRRTWWKTQQILQMSIHWSDRSAQLWPLFEALQISKTIYCDATLKR